jgi:hypothetical protein
LIDRSDLARKYNQVIDRESAYEILTEKIQEVQGEISENEKPKARGKEEKSVIESVMDNPLARQVGRTVARELTRGLLGVLGLGGSSTRRRKTGWF